ncbi:sensor histidine kinase [Muriicola jejuensis]|uniref:histidine kinase n=1 Tax=Muriicola jejuensis TaxID=504488 RepID=A0A6P0UAV9_9FLAO|nr:sensor histidine kinase [Muriicola jejuensis]NER09049.1 sensor histidine kinase [Muriicola jejuensis]
MKKNYIDQERFRDKEKLLIKATNYTSVLCLALFLICYFLLDITSLLSYIFLFYALLSLANTYAYRTHRNLSLTYNIASIASLVSTLLVVFLSGGITSPFIFALGLLVLAGYASTRSHGKTYLFIICSLVVLLFLQNRLLPLDMPNQVPIGVRDIFALTSVLFTVYLLGGIFGKDLMMVHHQLYKSKREMQARSDEKDTLLKEVHHRVKNNLQTVSSLLSLQGRSISDARTKSILKSSQNRVISMAMVHEMLYMREDLSKIQYRTYVRELSEYLVKSLKGANNKVTLKIDIPDIELGIDTAIPLGLLINEAITNSLKYGIKDDHEGEIHISIEQEDEHSYVLEIGDNGSGYSDAMTLKNSNSLGLKLIHNLARQLKGTITRDPSKKGTNYIVKFREIEPQPFPSVA